MTALTASTPTPRDPDAPAAKPSWTGWLASALPYLLVGTALRLFDINGQILVDDEWHSLNFVLGKSFFTVLTTHGLGANCIPQNVYNWLLLHTVGWSEAGLRFPSLLCGVLALVLLPPLSAKIIRHPGPHIFGWLLAISPCLTFYARFCRPYSMVVFFGFLALLALFIHLREKRSGFLLVYAFSSVLAIYYHAYAAIALLTPLICLSGLALVSALFGIRFNGVDPPGARSIALAGFIIVLLLGLLLLPANLANPWWTEVHGVDRVSLQSLFNFLMILAGTRSQPLSLIFALLALPGLLSLFHRDRLTGMLLFAILGAFAIFFSLATQEGMHAAIQIARYGILLLPIVFLLVSETLALFMRVAAQRVPRIGKGAAAIPAMPILLLGLTSPLRQTYVRPNNFTNQSAFQDAYTPFDWSKSRVRDLTPVPLMAAAAVPSFYRDHNPLDGVNGIIEYPMFIGDPLNLYYFYQHFHRREVAAGYIPRLVFPPLPSRDDFVYQTTLIDYVLGRAVREKGDMIRFTTMVALQDTDRLRREFGNWLIVVHRDFLKETLRLDPDTENGIVEPSNIAMGILARELGRPFYSDHQIVAWRVP